jgi:hypothetical protein
VNEGPYIRIDSDAVVESWRDNDGEVWVEFAPDRPAEPALFDTMLRALMAANEELSPDDFGTGVFGSVAGGVLLLKFPPREQVLRDWLDAFARQMRVEAWSGAVRPAPGDRTPDWISHLHEPILTMYVSYDVPSIGIGLPDLCEKATRWALHNGGPDAYLLGFGHPQLDHTGELGRHLYLALPATVMCISDLPGLLSWFSLAPDGHASYQVYDPRRAALALADRARAALLVDCERTRWAGTVLNDQHSYAWNTLTRTPGLKAPPWAPARNNPAWRRCVPDVCGMQLLTDEHLSRTTSLSGWTVTEPAPGHYLVEAPDLAAWFGPSGPSADVLAAARADFGRVIAPADLPER